MYKRSCKARITLRQTSIIWVLLLAYGLSASILCASEMVALAGETTSEKSNSFAEDILKESDYVRGADVDGLSMNSTVTSFKNGKEQKNYAMEIEADQNNTLVTFTAPARSKGIKMLMQERNMWFLSPEVKKPVPISPRQRLLGEANNGDLATTNYSRDYSVNLLGENTVEGKACYVLELKARDKSVTYDKIVYYLEKETKLGIKAEYFTISGKHFKTAMFQYDNRVKDNGREFNYVSRMEIRDAIASNEVTVLEYKNVERMNIPLSRFDKQELMRRK